MKTTPRPTINWLGALWRILPLLLLVAASAASHAQVFPVAVPENFATGPAGYINIGPPGVLSNDIYDGSATVILVSSTLHGKLTLASNGALTYNGDANYIGADRFEYEIKDEHGNLSNVAVDYIANGAIQGINYDQNPAMGPSTTLNFYPYLNFTPTGTVELTLKSSNPAVVSIPSSANTISANSYAKIPMNIKAVTVDTVVTISATYNNYTLTSNFEVVAPSPWYISFNNENPTGGDGNLVTGNLYIYGTAPTGGLKVTLTNSNPSACTVPTSVTVPATENTVSFPITTHLVQGTRNVTITASTPAGLCTAILSVKNYSFTISSSGSSELLADPRVSQPAIVACVDPHQYYNAANFKIVLSSNAPTGGLTLPIYTECPISGITAPSSVTIPAGQTTATVKVVLNGYEPANSSGYYTELYMGSEYLSYSNSAFVYVYPPLPVIALDGDDYEYGGTTFPALVSLEGYAPPGGAVVSLSSASGLTTIQPSVTIPAGSDFAEVNVSSLASSSFQPATLTASYLGFIDSTSFELLTPQVNELVLSSYTAVGGKTVTATVYLDGVAGAAGTKVNLVSSPSGLITPTTVTVPAGKSAYTFTLTTKAVSSDTYVTIHAYTWLEGESGDTESIELEP
jgi:hypothetical protein